jgi:hypothetical protein
MENFSHRLSNEIEEVIVPIGSFILSLKLKLEKLEKLKKKLFCSLHAKN